MEIVAFFVGALCGAGIVLFSALKFITAKYTSNEDLKKELDKKIPRRGLLFKSVTLTKGNGGVDESINLEIEFSAKEESSKRVKVHVINVKSGRSGHDNMLNMTRDMLEDSWIEKDSTHIEWLGNDKMDNRRRVISDILDKKKK